MFKKVLVANRGEIATRIIRACNEMGLKTAAIFAQEDCEALHIRKADEAYLVGPGPIEGYLNAHRIVDLCLEIGADAIHPGYGFLSENPLLPKLCEQNGITFIGPTSEAIAMMGDKITAKQTVIKAGVPTVPGSEGNIEDHKEAIKLAEKIGYPVMVKATGGGGGRGLRVAQNSSQLLEAMDAASREAKGAFGKPEIFLEKYIEEPHHIEFQILADKYGNTIHLGERDCSIQRRHQKLIEIAPSLLLTPELRKEMGDAAVRVAKAVNYSNAGTVEFLLDKNGNYYFIEMNTRIQVEHTVTEVVTGVDIVKNMIEIASGKKLELKQEDVLIRGYAIECRINAEDPKRGFMPYVGKITSYTSPGGIGVRIDGTVYQGYTIPGFYDSMVAKLTVSGLTWEETAKRTARALREYSVKGIKTTISFLTEIVQSEKFLSGDFSTKFIDENPELLNYEEKLAKEDLALIISSAIAAHSGL